MRREPLPFLNPESDRKVDTSAGSNSDAESEANITFWLGTRRVTARGEVCGHHPNVIFPRVLPSLPSLLLFRLSCLLPTAWRERLEARWPEWFLPDDLVMKREKPNWQEEFDNEVDIYKLLAPLGGHVVPKLYGQTKYPGTDKIKRRALIMSNIGGVWLGEPEVGSLPLDHVEEMLNSAFRSIADAGVAHCDTKLDNMHIVGDKIMIFDFDTSEKAEDNVSLEREVGYSVSWVLRQYINRHDRFPKGIPWGVLPCDRPSWPRPPKQEYQRGPFGPLGCLEPRDNGVPQP
ncbi:hypothetical protein GGTG_04574 [Gaeumannomyces tritici R3-111a-1]|uniref:Protein kinase domain-containing protein n=1 Tax=Gaeumannomyces tritici (strain R3-111a-1) TaxID=644352 RepID=J3NTH5_GAET3|nr:hypothetical protein GGTG_04574 [Gaeumannomyces tritici R3-111a-1]EJT79490.1 hypothetical protein GGTG_04574 [Gaeumannomyces tritici R3-111a-1]